MTGTSGRPGPGRSCCTRPEATTGPETTLTRSSVRCLASGGSHTLIMETPLNPAQVQPLGPPIVTQDTGLSCSLEAVIFQTISSSSSVLEVGLERMVNSMYPCWTPSWSRWTRPLILATGVASTNMIHVWGSRGSASAMTARVTTSSGPTVEVTKLSSYTASSLPSLGNVQLEAIPSPHGLRVVGARSA